MSACPTPCDDGCPTACHEQHLPATNRLHHEGECPSAWFGAQRPWPPKMERRGKRRKCGMEGGHAMATDTDQYGVAVTACIKCGQQL